MEGVYYGHTSFLRLLPHEDTTKITNTDYLP